MNESISSYEMFKKKIQNYKSGLGKGEWYYILALSSLLLHVAQEGFEEIGVLIC